MELRLEIDIRHALRGLDHLQKQLNYAVARALTRTAKAAQAEISKIPATFQSVVPLTARAVLMKPALAADGIAGMEAMVYIRNEAPKGTPPSKYLRAEILGGARHDKRSEHAFQSAGIMQPGQQWVGFRILLAKNFPRAGSPG